MTYQEAIDMIKTNDCGWWCRDHSDCSQCRWGVAIDAMTVIATTGIRDPHRETLVKGMRLARKARRSGCLLDLRMGIDWEENLESLNDNEFEEWIRRTQYDK